MLPIQISFEYERLLKVSKAAFYILAVAALMVCLEIFIIWLNSGKIYGSQTLNSLAHWSMFTLFALLPSTVALFLQPRNETRKSRICFSIIIALIVGTLIFYLAEYLFDYGLVGNGTEGAGISFLVVGCCLIMNLAFYFKYIFIDELSS